MTEIVIPVRPMPFKRVRTHGKRFFNDPDYTAYKNIVNSYMRQWMALYQLSEPFKGPLSLSLWFDIERPKKSKNGYPRGDIDNFAKSILDAGNKTLWNDDNQIVDLRVRKDYGVRDCVRALIVMWKYPY